MGQTDCFAKCSLLLTIFLTLYVQRNHAEPFLQALMGGPGGRPNLVRSLSQAMRSVQAPFLPPLNRAAGDIADVEQTSNLEDSIDNLGEVLEEELRRQESDAERRPYESQFCYDEELSCGPNSWKDLCRSGRRQSPINLNTSSATVINASQSSIMHPLVFNYPTEEVPLFISHNGHSVVVQVSREGKSNASLHVKTPDIDAKYNFSHLHFHWGKSNDNGSEHTLDGKSFAMELHLVHYRTEHQTLEAALSAGKDASVAVVTIFVKVGKTENPFIADIAKVFHTTKIMTPGLMRTQKKISLHDLVPRGDSFYLYKGSLTVPNCAEKVLWLVFPDPIYIDKKQMKVFRDIKEGEPKDPITGKLYTPDEISKMEPLNNVRPIQELNGRTVTFYNFNQ